MVTTDQTATGQVESEVDELHDEGVTDWTRMCSKHLYHIEHRLMESQFLGHEVVRQMGEIWNRMIASFWVDLGWGMRKALDIGVRALRTLVYYNGCDAFNETTAAFHVRAIKLVRLYYEESFVRSLYEARGNSNEDKLTQAAMCSLVVSIHQT